tara:strand:- start:4478 stop:5278 length:801 start_codon:yes stop_codon:yes gene_type:complete
MEENLKKRGRKKIITENKEEILQNHDSETLKKKRGRKKKWETTPFKNNYNTEGVDNLVFEETAVLNKEKYSTNALNFGNLCIEVHDKNAAISETIHEYFNNHKPSTDCDIILSSDEEDTCDIKKETSLKLKMYTNNKTEQEINKKTVIRCYNCHHSFENAPFFLPIDHCSKLDRYKLFGNFCSPNCVKSYCMNNKVFENKLYIVGQFYRRLFGPNFRINPAQNILCLKEYGGNLTIDEYRKFFYKNSRYSIKNINCKIIYINSNVI